MKTLLVACLLGAALVAASDASAGLFGSARQYGTITVPPEWAGIWQTTDSTYDCKGVLQSVTTSLDTLCAGQTFESDTTVSCTGSATSTTFDEHCTATGEIAPDCNYNLDLVTHGTRTGDTFFAVTVYHGTYVGSGSPCGLLPDQCQQINQHSTRTGPAPTEYCSTPAEPTSWGRVKSIYR
jgi:hypothetical protein